MKLPCVYVLASKPNGVLYIGVTSNLEGRMAEHDQGLIEGFTKRYGVKWLVYYEFHDTMDEAIRREKCLKEWKRACAEGPTDREHESAVAQPFRPRHGRDRGGTR